MLIIGSGNIVHNLRAVDFGHAEEGFDWAERFDERAREVLLSNPAEVTVLGSHPDFDLAVPTPDHYLPMLYIAGLAEEEPLEPLVNGQVAGSISMAAYTLGMTQQPEQVGNFPPGSEFPDVPITESNY